MAHSAPFRRASFRIARALAVGIASSSLLLVGCDSASSKADKSVSEKLDEASQKMNGADADRAAAHQELDEASTEAADASMPVRLRAKVLLADSELRIAQDLAAQIQKNDVLIDRLVREIALLGGEIESNNRRAIALAKKDPKAVQDFVAQKQADVKGSDDKPDWYKSPDVSLPSLWADDKQAAAIQTQISQLQDTIKSETDQRNQLVVQADKLTEQSYHEQKEKSVDLYVQGSNARKQAADLSVKLDQDNAALARAQADLAIRSGQHESLTAALKGFDEKSAYFAKDWSDVQATIADLNAKSKDIMGDDPVEKPEKNKKTGDLVTAKTIGSKAAAIAKLAEENRDLRGRAEPAFNSAIDKYRDAADLAQKIQLEISDKQSKKADPQESPDAPALDEEKYALDPSNYRFPEADAEFQKAEFLAAAAAEDKTRLDLLERIKPVVANAQLTLFPTLDDPDGTIASQMKSAQDSARQAYTDSTDLLSKIYDGTGTPEQKLAAQVQEIFAQYSWWAMENAAGDAQKAADHMNFARNAVAAATTAGAMVPPLPPELTAPAQAPAR